MSTARKIFLNTIIQTAGKAVAIIIGLFTVNLIASYLEEVGFGQYSIVLAFLGFAAVFADLGLYLTATREISKPNSDSGKILSNALGIRLVFSLIILLLAAGIAWLFPYERVVKQTMFLGIGAFLFVNLNQVLLGVFQKHLATQWSTIAELVGRTINLGLVYLFIREDLSFSYFILAALIANGSNFFVTFLTARRYEHFSIAFDFAMWRSLLILSLPLAFSVILNLLYFKTDTIILSIFHPAQAVGVYSLPYKILEVLLAFPAMFVGLIMPLLARGAFGAWDRFRMIFQKTFYALLILAIPMITVTLFFAEPIIDLVKDEGPGFADSPHILRILILAVGVIFFGTLFGYSVVAVNQQKNMVKGYLAGAIIGLILYFSLIPKYSYWGAAWGTLATEIIVAGFAFYLVKKVSMVKLAWATIIRIFPGLISLVVFFYYTEIFWVFEIVVGLGIYGILLFVFKAIPLDFLSGLLLNKRVRNG